MQTVERYNVFDHILAFESGSLDYDETVELFQALVDSGLVWQLQGSYGRTAERMIDAGLITLPQKRGMN